MESSNRSLQTEPSVFEQLRDFRSKIPKDLLTQWEKPTGFRCLVYIVQDWAIILIGHQLFIQRPCAATFMAAMFLMAWGHRGLSNLAHDSIHRNLTSDKACNDILADLFLAPPLMNTARIQKRTHTAHHHYLGTKDDPDHGLHNDTSLRHYRNGRFDHTSIFPLFLYNVFDPVIFLDHAIGSFRAAPLHITLWWIIMTAVTGLLESTTFHSIPIGYRFFLLFHTARCTLTYIFYILREIIDHSGLPSTSILSFTRTSPCCNMLQKFLQPHDDNYHLLHHLLPRIPMSKLHNSHEWLVENVQVYERANRHTSYLSGKDALFAQALHEHVLAPTPPSAH